MSDTMEALATRARMMCDHIKVLREQAESLDRDVRLLGNNDLRAPCAGYSLAAAMVRLEDLATAIDCEMAVAALPADASEADYHATCERFAARRAA